MQFSRSEDVCLAHKALPLWVSLLSSAERAQRGQQGEFTLPLEVAAALMDLAGVEVILLSCNPETAFDGSGFHSCYRSCFTAMSF